MQQDVTQAAGRRVDMELTRNRGTDGQRSEVARYRGRSATEGAGPEVGRWPRVSSKELSCPIEAKG